MAAKRQAGQAATDMLVTAMLFILITCGLVHMALLIVPRFSANYAAFASARAAMVHGSVLHSKARLAARDAMRPFAAAGTLESPTVGVRGGRRGLVLPFYMPMGTLLYPDQDARGVLVEGFAPLAILKFVPEVGDNAKR